MLLKKKRKYITKEKVRDITILDLQKEFHLSKAKPQRTLKHTMGFLFTAQDPDLNIQLLSGIKRKRPQRYWLTEMMIENPRHNENKKWVIE